MQFRKNQKVRVLRRVTSDSTCPGCRSGCELASAGDIGYVHDVAEALFRPLVAVHFIERSQIVGFREQELEILEDYDPDQCCWIPLEPSAVAQ